MNFEGLTARWPGRLIRSMESLNIPSSVKFVMIVASQPPKLHPAVDLGTEWRNFLSSIQTTEMKYAPTKKIHENVWLINLHTGLPLLGELLCRAKDKAIPMQIVFLHEEPDWIEYPPPFESAPEVPCP
jgi:hypothetical protein